MGELGDAFSFGRYADALAQQGAMHPDNLALVEAGVLGALGLGAFILLVLSFVRRSGTAAAGFALLILVALSEAILFGGLSFITPGTKILIGALTASAMLLFTNAVLHTGRENLLVAGLSAVVIAGLLALGGAVVAGLPLGAESRFAMLAACALSGVLLGYAIVRDPAGKAIIGLSLLLAILGALMMTAEVVPLTRGVLPVTAPSVIVAAGILLATLSAPFLPDDIRVPSRREREAAAPMMPASLFDDDEAPVISPAREAHPLRERHEPSFSFTRTPKTETSVPALETHEPPAEEVFEPEPAREAFAASAETPASNPFARQFGDQQDPVSNHWSPGASGVILEAADDEYIWDALAQPEVRCGGIVLDACGGSRPDDLTPEGFRERLHPEALARFDDLVLGGGEPESGPFEVPLETDRARFVLEGRRKVDHDGILMRIDAIVRDVQRAAAALPAPLAAVPESFKPVRRLADSMTVGFEALPEEKPTSADDVKAVVLEAGRVLKAMAEDNPQAGVFAMLDASSLKAKPGLLAAAVGKAVRVHELNRGAFVVGLKPPQPKDAKAFKTAVEDIRRAGGRVAWAIDDPKAKPVKVEADMLWVSSGALMTGKRAKKSPLEALEKRFGLPILIRDLVTEGDAAKASALGATFGAGRAFGALETPGQGASDADGSGRRLSVPGGKMSALRAGGLR